MRVTPTHAMLCLYLAAGILSSARAAPDEACPTPMAARANTTLAQARASWPALRRHWRSYAACDDGVLAEGYSDAVVWLLAHRRHDVDAFIVLSHADPSFGKWALQHVDASASDADLNKVTAHAAACERRSGSDAICGAIAQAARAALSEGDHGKH